MRLPQLSAFQEESRQDPRTPLRLESSLFEIFHENTKLGPLLGQAYGAHVRSILRSPAHQKQMAQPYKVYSLRDQVELELPQPTGQLEETIARRRSLRAFSGEPVGLAELSRLLRFSYGRTMAQGSFRAVASGGALYPLEVYVVTHRVEGLASGIYHYDAESHRLDVVDRNDRWAELKEVVWMSDMKEPDQASCVLVLTAFFERSTFKYLDRGYRMVLMEAGEVAQNLSLMAVSLGLGNYFLGGFYDDALSQLLRIDGVDEAPILPIVLGRRSRATP